MRDQLPVIIRAKYCPVIMLRKQKEINHGTAAGTAKRAAAATDAADCLILVDCPNSLADMEHYNLLAQDTSESGRYSLYSFLITGARG